MDFVPISRKSGPYKMKMNLKQRTPPDKANTPKMRFGEHRTLCFEKEKLAMQPAATPLQPAYREGGGGVGQPRSWGVTYRPTVLHQRNTMNHPLCLLEWKRPGSHEPKRGNPQTNRHPQ